MSVENPLWGAPRIHGELLKRAITPQMVQKFARTARERIRTDGSGYHTRTRRTRAVSGLRWARENGDNNRV